MAKDFTFCGMKIVLNVQLVKSVQKTVPRSMKERLLSRPWRPLLKTKTIMVSEPDTNVYVNGDTIYIHPSMKEALMAALDERNKTR